MRAAIPWTDPESRSNLRSYTGLTRVWDARVICRSPTLINVSVILHHPIPALVGYQARNNETVKVAAPADEPFVNASDPSPTTITPMPTLTLINATISTPNPMPTAIEGFIAEDDSYGPLSYRNDWSGSTFFNCTLVLTAGGSVCKTNSSNIELETLGHLFNSTRGYMVVNTTLPYYTIASPEDYVMMSEAIANLTAPQGNHGRGWKVQQDGPWTKISNTSDQGFALSFCSTLPYMVGMNVTMTGTSNDIEATIDWVSDSEDPETGVLDTLRIRRQLGVTGESLTVGDRGLLSLGLDKGLIDYKSNDGRIRTLGSGLMSLSTTYILSTLNMIRQPNGDRRAHESISSLFLDTLSTTGNPALAIQAISTVLQQMEYYNQGYRWSVASPASYVMFEKMSIPTKNLGLSAVFAMIAAQFIIMGVTLVLFVQRTEASSLGNTWQAVAQVVSDDTLPILLQADDLKDKEMKKIIAESEESPAMTGVIRRRLNRRNQFGPREEGFD
ncbi:hypothetical protein PG985_011609 [Apiospora marii]|uniref:uncharacterized protein n=1 Tax=Apiospora marii TaxID=335849 RepID=UPI00312F0CE5